MPVRLIERAPLRVVYLRHTGPYGASVADFWQRVVLPWLVANQRFGEPLYGVAHDNPAVTAPEDCRYDVCLEMRAPLCAPGAAGEATLAGGRYAATAFRGTPSQRAAAWAQLRDEWLPAHGLRPDGRPFLEIYPAIIDYDPRTGAFGCELAIPVGPV